MTDKNRKNIKIQSSKYMNSLFVWNFKASFAGKWIEFQDFREYTPWDDAKYIDWARSSMESSMIMRRYKEEKSSDILCYIDMRESYTYQDGLKLWLVRDITDLLYHASISSSEKFGWYIDSKSVVEYIAPKRNPSSLLKIHNFSWDFHEITDTLSISALMNPKLKRSIIFIISDSMNIDEKSFKTAWLKHDIIYIHISSHFEDTLSEDWISYLRWIWWNISIDLSDKQKKLEYQELREKTKNEFSVKIKKMWIDSMFLSEKSSLPWEFLKLMKKRLNYVK